MTLGQFKKMTGKIKKASNRSLMLFAFGKQVFNMFR